MLLTTIAALTFTTPDLPPAPLPSDQVGVYGLISRVVFQPSPAAATAVQVYGAFAVAEGRTGDYYRSPRWGYLAFKLDPKAVDKCRAQWNDLAKVAGTKAPVGFGFRYKQRGVRVWQDGDANVKSAVFETGMGIRKVRNVHYGPLVALECFPRPTSPTEGAAPVVARGGRRGEQKIVLEVENCVRRDADMRYLFEVRRANGDVFASGPITPGELSTKFETWVALQPGETVQWSCRVIAEGLKRAPVAVASFKVAPAASKKQR